MDINNLPFMKTDRQFKLTGDDVVMLTEKGKSIAEEKAHSGGRAQVLLTLNDGGSNTIKELSNDTRLPIDRVKAIVGDLMKRAEVRKVGYEG